MITHVAIFLWGIASGVLLHVLYIATRPKGSPWRRDVRKWWGQNEDIIEVERRKREEDEERHWKATHRPPPTIPGQESIAIPTPVVRRIESYATPADQGQRDTPPHREGDRQAPVTLRQPGAGSEGRDAATSGRYRTALVLDENVEPDWGEMRNADLAIRYFGDHALVVKDHYGELRRLDMADAEELLARSDVVLHRSETAAFTEGSANRGPGGEKW